MGCSAPASHTPAPQHQPRAGGGRIAQPQHLRSCQGQGDGHGGFPLQQGNHARCTQGMQLLHSIQVPEQEWEVEAEAGADTDPGSDSSQDGKGLCLGQNVQTNPKDVSCLEGFSQAVAGWQGNPAGDWGVPMIPQECLNWQQALSVVRQMQKLLVAQEAAHLQGTRGLRHQLSILQSRLQRPATKQNGNPWLVTTMGDTPTGPALIPRPTQTA